MATAYCFDHGKLESFVDVGPVKLNASEAAMYADVGAVVSAVEYACGGHGHVVLPL